ncbi:MAG TPA: alpha/beta hydrolase [Chryseosolibacter sp.]
MLFNKKIIHIGAFALLFSTVLSACENKSKEARETPVKKVSTARDTTKVKDLKPKGGDPAWGKTITDNMLVVIEKLDSFTAAPIETLSAKQARQNPTPTDAVMAVMKEKGIAPPVSKVDTSGQSIAVKGGNIHARIYTPQGAGPFPVIVYYHGGGWVIADLDTYDASAKGLAEQVGAVVVSVHYRQGPEHKFPTAHNDAYAAYEWVTKNSQSIKGDANRIAVVGESAGGNLAANVSIMARDKKIALPLHQVLVYPIASDNLNSESYTKNAKAKPLNKAMMVWFMENYLPSKASSGDPRIALVKAELKGLPETTIVTAEIDPLLSDGELLRDKLKDAQVEVDYKEFKGVTHEFFGMATVLPEAKDAQAWVAKNLKDAFEMSARK